jgi:alpha-tubulin suppressor-like RCC1 family protein
MATSMPPELASGGIVTAVAGGMFHGLALLTNGSVLGWDKAPSARLLPLPEGRIATQVAAGSHSSFVVLDNGSLLAWGSFSYDGSSTWATMAVPQLGASIVSVAAGFSHAAVALSNGTIAGFGSNSYGQLSFPPELLQPGAGVVQVAAGYFRTVALTSVGRVHAFGYCGFWQCSVPGTIQGRGVRKVGAGGYTSYALLGGSNFSSGGQLLAWGRDFGQQAALQGLTNVVDFAAGGDHVVVLLATSEARAFGYNGLGQVRTGWRETCHLGKLWEGPI